jgi:hypothetical protein
LAIGPLPVPSAQNFFFRYFAAPLIVSLAAVPLFPSVTVINLSLLGAYVIGALSLGLILRSLAIFFADFLTGLWMPSALRRRLIERLQKTLQAAQEAPTVWDGSVAVLDNNWWKAARAQLFIRSLPHLPDPVRHNALSPLVLAPTIYGNIHMAFALDMDRHFASATSPLLGQRINPVVQASWTLPPPVFKELLEVSAPGEAAFSTATGMIILALFYLIATIHAWWHPLAHGTGSATMLVVSSLLAYMAYCIATRELAGAYDAIRTLVTAGLMSSSLIVQRDTALRTAFDVGQRWKFEKIWNVIYRSQIQILEYLSGSGDGSASWNDLQKRFYDPVTARDPIFALYKFPDYMSFLLRTGLVADSTSGTSEDPSISIMPLGRNFLAYLVSQGYTKDMRIY